MDRSNQNLHLDNQLCFALYATSLAMSKAYQPHLSALGLTYPQYLVMLVLWESDHLSVSAICNRLFLDSGTLTPVLKRLEASNYISRVRDSEDERRVFVHLSNEGRKLKEKILPISQIMLKKTQCSRSEIIQLLKDLHELGEKLRTTQPKKQKSAGNR